MISAWWLATIPVAFICGFILCLPFAINKE